MGFTADRRVHLSAFGDSAIWAVAVIGSDMYLMQALIFCAVVGSNIHGQWTPNQYLASGIGAGCALIATHIVVKWRDRRARRKPNRNEATPGRAASSQTRKKE